MCRTSRHTKNPIDGSVEEEEEEEKDTTTPAAPAAPALALVPVEEEEEAATPAPESQATSTGGRLRDPINSVGLCICNVGGRQCPKRLRYPDLSPKCC